ncbi:VaFE repeat-containing surface-anchored protein [Ruania alkalisoli]|uniref:VaFE repeat-containing surface-anchored protein n=1 Tax=Ruania alkalisoli TaxID=2779775 RepID=A0A7M1SUC3_9MICO|nr:VaFE repeat-containing surface-anchored protein [Ruania alkalisoli]QOR71081.1 VaFE repeat-containing surface-anchored protein [Ruania alkalisoli]
MRSGNRIGRWLAAALLALGVVVAPGVAAAVDLEPGDTPYIGSKEGYGGTGLFPIWSNGSPTGDPDYWAYCIEQPVAAMTGLVGEVDDLDGYLGDNYFADPEVQGKVFWVLAHSYPELSLQEFGEAIGVPGISRNDAIEATQYAIWRYTDLTFDASWPFESADSEAAYWYLVNGANANPGLTYDDLEVTAAIAAPGSAQSADSLVGPFVVNTNQPTVSVTVDPAITVTDASGTPVDTDAVADGQELYLDLRGTTAEGEATVQVTAAGTSSTGKIVSVPTVPGTTPTAEDHAQTIILVTPSTTRTTAEASVSWTALPVPVIGTSLVDAADSDRVLPFDGGVVVDTVTYENLTPGVEYTVTGELMHQSDGSGSGITGSTTFTPDAASGSVDVEFTVPTGFAGESLVAFERLFEGADVSGEPVAVHEDIDDEAQTVTVEEAPVPAIGTSLVDAADGDRVLPFDGGVVVDTVAFENLTPGVEYTVTGELMYQSDGSGSGIVGSVTFIPDAASGSVEVEFTVPAGFAGESLVAFERLFEGTDTTGDPVAVHEDIDDEAQTVTVEDAPAPVPELPSTGFGVAGGAVPTTILLTAVGIAMVLLNRRWNASSALAHPDARRKVI